jgi:hypothetical protein
LGVGFRVSFDGEGTPDDAESLYHWLASDPDIRENAELSLAPPAGQRGDMGPVLEVVNVVLSNSFAGASLLVSVLTAWRSSRERTPTIKVEANGVTVTIEGGGPATTSELARKLCPMPSRQVPPESRSAAAGSGE